MEQAEYHGWLTREGAPELADGCSKNSLSSREFSSKLPSLAFSIAEFALFRLLATEPPISNKAD